MSKLKLKRLDQKIKIDSEDHIEDRPFFKTNPYLNLEIIDNNLSKNKSSISKMYNTKYNTNSVKLLKLCNNSSQDSLNVMSRRSKNVINRLIFKENSTEMITKELIGSSLIHAHLTHIKS